MKKTVFLIFFSSLFFLTSCLNNDDGYSLSDMWIGLGIVEETNSYKIKMDNGDILIPVSFGGYYYGYENESHNNNRRIEAGDRVLVNFTILDEKKSDAGEIVAYYVKINSSRKVLMKGILDITPENEDSIGSDPIIVKDYWVTNNLLNVELKYWGRNKVHFINLVKQPGDLSAGDQPFALEIRHNSNGDEESIPYQALVSFKLDSLQIAGVDSVRFKVKSIDYDGKSTEFNGVYKYNASN